MNKIYFVVLLLCLNPYRLWSSDEKPAAEESGSLPCLKVSSGCRKFIKDNKSAGMTTQKCIDDILAGNEVKGVEIEKSEIAECKKIRSQLKTK